MEITRELLEKFIKNQCNADESEAVAKHLLEHPDLLDELLPVQKWEQIDDSHFLSTERSAEIRRKIWSTLKFNHPKRQYYWWMAAAASLIIMLYINTLQTKAPTPSTKQAEFSYNLVKINYGKDDLELKIEDGSLITLKPGSEIRYAEHFKGNGRNFYLKGNARFKVAKDRSRPFKVYASGMVTTALGTDFIVYAYPDANNTKIVLYEGKVVVKPEDQEMSGKMKAVYLLPGQQLSVNKNTYLASLGLINKKQPKTEMLKKGSTELTASSIIFKNQSLQNIYSLLEKEFDTEIHYRNKDISNRYFTGTFNRDSLTANKIIEETSLLNDLTITMRNQVYYLKSSTKQIQKNHKSPLNTQTTTTN